MGAWRGVHMCVHGGGVEGYFPLPILVPGAQDPWLLWGAWLGRGMWGGAAGFACFLLQALLRLGGAERLGAQLQQGGGLHSAIRHGHGARRNSRPASRHQCSHPSCPALALASCWGGFGAAVSRPPALGLPGVSVPPDTNGWGVWMGAAGEGGGWAGRTDPSPPCRCPARLRSPPRRWATWSWAPQGCSSRAPMAPSSQPGASLRVLSPRPSRPLAPGPGRGPRTGRAQRGVARHDARLGVPASSSAGATST